MRNKKGERLLFEQLYEMYEQKVYYCAYHILQKKEQAEDVTQDVFIQLYNDRKTWQSYDEIHLIKYLLRVTKNKAIDAYRKNSTKMTYLKNYREDENSRLFENEIDDYLITEEIINELMSELKEPYRRVFMYRIFYELSFKEIATILFSREDTVRKQYERSRIKLQTILGGETDEETKLLRKRSC